MRLAVAVAASLAWRATALTFDCEKIVIDGIRFDLSALGGPKQVHNIEEEFPTTSNHTFAIDICNNLPIPKKKEKGKLNCSSGTRICYTKYDYNTEEGTHLVEKIYPIAGTFDVSHGKSLDPYITRLKNSKSHSDADREGLIVELNGGYSSDSKKTSRDQKAIVEFACDPERTGLEDVEEVEKDAQTDLNRRADDDNEDNDDTPKNTSSLRFISYKDEGEKLDVLRLQWMTKHACEKRSDDDSKASKSHWGFFTWTVVIVFLAVATYLIFGSWLNYSRHGARGWDLLPHGDTLRDLPYVLKDWMQTVSGMFAGRSSRGGYSAV